MKYPNQDDFTKKRLTGSYVSSVVSIALVLFTMGLFGVIILNVNKLSELIKENIGFEVMMNENAREAGILQLQKMLDAHPQVKSTYYISREEATQRLAQDLGEDFIQWLGKDENPLLPSIEVKFRAAWANSDSLARMEHQLMQNPDVKEVYYQKSLIDNINRNIRRISIILLVIVTLLVLISMALINNTIRLSVYAKRFLIRSMQLVGATESFIKRPFVLTGILQGIIGAFLALILLSVLMFFAMNAIPELVQLQDLRVLGMLSVLIVLVGATLTGISTHFALRKYLRTRTDNLFI
ncbi:MAG: cell division protein FtsX [Bacteroidales bacterium]|nr:cell division protein FtsX [Bacteroidales bacterium]